MVVINRMDRITKNEQDQFMARQYIDLLLTHSSLVLVTLPNHPSTLDLYPSLASRLSAGFLLHIPNESSSTQQRKREKKTAKRLQTRPGHEHDTKTPQMFDAKATDTVNRIIFAVARHFSVTEKDIRHGSQRRCHVRPRGLAIYCIREMTDLSSHDIGRFFGGRDHSTVLHSLKVTTKILQQDHGIKADLRAIRSRLQQPNVC
jgi:chromosomal replication initiation ATPase DnaA